jgi:hypothetical protein
LKLKDTPPVHAGGDTYTSTAVKHSLVNKPD